MTDYLIAKGWDKQGSFVDWPTANQPRTEEVTPGRTQWGGDQMQYMDGAWDAYLVCDALKDAEFATLLAALGLAYNIQSAPITIYMPHRDMSWYAWNAIVSYPEATHKPRRFEPVRFPLKLVEKVTYTP